MSAERSLALFYNSDLYSDVILRVKGTSIQAHRVILAQSEYFEGLFNSKMKETTILSDGKVVIELSEISPRSLEIYLGSLYGKELPELSFRECAELYRETDRFLAPMFSRKLVDRMGRYYMGRLSDRDLLVYCELMTTYDLNLPIYPSHILSASVICALSYPAICRVVGKLGGSAYVSTILWVASHPETPDDQVNTLLTLAKPEFNLRSEEIAVIRTYLTIPVLHEYIIDLLCLSVTDLRGNAQVALQVTYRALLEIRQRVKAGILDETVESKKYSKCRCCDSSDLSSSSDSDNE